MADEGLEVRDDVDVDEVDCEEASVELNLPDEERRLSEEEEGAQVNDVLSSEDLAALDEDPDDDEDGVELEHTGGFDFLKPGGGFAGTEAIGRRAERVGTRRGLTVTSMKRSSGSPGSDHHISQKESFAVDLSNGSSPTPQMDRTARRLASVLGQPGFFGPDGRRGGVLSVTRNGFRCQVLYRTKVGGDHFNHVHFGVRRL